jgi:hypothetical protein
VRVVPNQAKEGTRATRCSEAKFLSPIKIVYFTLFLYACKEENKLDNFFFIVLGEVWTHGADI